MRCVSPLCPLHQLDICPWLQVRDKLSSASKHLRRGSKKQQQQEQQPAAAPEPAPLPEPEPVPAAAAAPAPAPAKKGWW
jgi:hypothetical protein